MNDPSTTISEADLTRLLPTCQRCRRLRRKCDTQLPACRLCQKGQAECTFLDHALQQTLPRSYVHSLLNRLARLRSVQATVGGAQESTGPFSTSLLDLPRPPSVNVVEPREHGWGTHTSALSFDKHFVLDDANPTCWQFFGSSSAYALAVEVLVHAQAKFGQVTHPENYTGPEFMLNKQIYESLDPPVGRRRPDREEIQMLVNLYASTTNTLHGYSDNECVGVEIDTYLRHHGTNVKSLTGIEAHHFFRVAMICAIASANKARHHAVYDTESFVYFREAVQCVEEITSDASIDSLQALLLLILFAFFYPRRGDVWKLLDSACRLSVELDFHSETNDEYEDERVRQRRRSIFWGLYCLERTFGQHVGRPSDLPEEIITAEYPATLITTSTDPAYSQYMLVSHYYRLVYIRSEIFRELYMPATAPSLPHSWYEERLQTIISWQREYDGVVRYEGMGVMTCDMGFNTSVCFLFQPLLLRALAATKEPNLADATVEVIPKESYDAACQSIRFYKKVLQSPEGSLFGDYPVTIVSAHYVHQATLIILAHCLLAVDGRLPIVSFSLNKGDSSMTNLDFRDIYSICADCVSILEFCADKWPGMVGILDIFRGIQERVLPVMVSNGLV